MLVSSLPRNVPLSYDEHTAWGNAAKIGGSSETLTCGDIAAWGHHDKQDQQTAA
jgi:hypothetical protein